MCVSVYAETCKTNHAVHTADIYCLLLFSIPNMTNSVCRRPTIRFRMKIYIFEMEYTIYGLRSDPHHHKDRNNIARWREHRTRGIFILCGQFYLFCFSFPALLQTFPFHFSLSHFFHSLPSLYPLLSLSHDCSLCHFPSSSPLQFRFFLFRPYFGCTLDSLFASIQSSKREQKLYGSVLRHKFMIFFSKECVCNKHAEPWRKSWNLETISCCLKYLVTNDMFQMHVPQ